MERAPSRAKATNVLRPASRAQDPAFARHSAPSPTAALHSQQHQPMRVLPGGARLVSPSPGVQPAPQGVLRRAPSASHFYPLVSQPQLQLQPQPQPQQMGGGQRQRVGSYYEGMPTGDYSAVPRAISRSGSRAELGGISPAHHQQPRSTSRAGRPGPAPGGAWPGQMGMGNLFGGGFGTMGVGPGPMGPDMSGPMSPVTPQFYPAPQTPMMMGGPGSRPGSSLQQGHPARPATASGLRGSGAEADSPTTVNVARGGARVIGPMRAKPMSSDGPSFLNPIPQSPSSALGGMFPGPNDFGAARESIRSALSNDSVESGRSRANSAVRPTEESMEAAEARVSRKIQDLEISNKSLLAVNSQLESRVKTQRDKINELKKQLQLKVPFVADTAADSEISDEDAKSALEYRSTIAAGKVISAAELDEDGPAAAAAADTQDDHQTDTDSNAVAATAEGAPSPQDKAAVDEQDAEGRDNDKADDGDDEEKSQQARELVARLMVLALTSPEPPTPEKLASRIPKRAGSAAGPTGGARPQSALKGGLRTPVKSASSRISSFGVASANTPVRSLAVSPTPSAKASADSGRDQPPGAPSEKEQILDICRQLQQIL
ncbi:hypothetical protein GGF46_005541 [Coemansia sp. RSA 552]|nr:hypothetical protein GGF46_005541 [Coemansia sp. RSA 552]